MSKEIAPTKITAEQRDLEFRKIMSDVQNSMSWSERAFSKFIHIKAIEKIGVAIGSTVARPSAILTGSLFALVLPSIIYIIAKHYGYPLTGSESIIAFIAGWIVGTVIDLIRTIFGRKKT
ncbi:hypothetical protein FWF74_01955 [Candidatus Saccharibacteria bacterium]|nr:hypothetical protein [Candidatus Saccharibacteria bacterium]MCL1963142.1 hypothetical protein [Candidatus Saccharibacteria bacterium]